MEVVMKSREQDSERDKIKNEQCEKKSRETKKEKERVNTKGVQGEEDLE